MPGLFEGVSKGLDIGTELALKKMDLDRAKERLGIETGIKMRQLANAEESLALERQSKAREAGIKDLGIIQKQAETPDISQGQLSKLNEGAMSIQSRLGLPATGLPRERVNITEPGVRDIAMGLREEAGMPQEITGDFITQPTPLELAEAKAKIGGEVTEKDRFKAWVDLTKQSSKNPTTAMAKYIQDNPNATANDIALYSQKLKGKGIKTTLPDGTVIEIGGGTTGEGGMDKVTSRKIQGKLIDVNEASARLREIERTFNPKFLTIDTKFSAWATEWKDKLQGMKIPFTDVKLDSLVDLGISENEYKQATKFWDFRRNAISNINLYIKEITGAQMSEKEAGRIRKGMPDPGEGVFDGDSPREFASKWNSVMKSVRLSQARYVMYLKRGLDVTTVNELRKTDSMIDLTQMDKEIQAYGNSLAKQGFTKEAIAAKIREQFFTK